jgi:hypothetical protein
MRKVVGYAFQRTLKSPAEARTCFTSIDTSIEDWLKSKGQLAIATGVFAFDDGRSGAYSCTRSHVEGASLVEHLLHEPTDSGPIQTDVRLGLKGSNVLVYCELRAGAPLNWVGPVALDIRCPKVVRSILDTCNDWKLGEVVLSTKPFKFFGAQDALTLDAVIWHPDRNLPVVCISQDQDGPLTGDLAERFAADLSGLAIVALTDADAAWTLTKTRGKEWSCFNGAIRLYWPKVGNGTGPLDHPLWTKHSLLTSSASAELASHKIRQQLRRRILGLSAFSVNEPADLRHIRETFRAKKAEKERAELQNNADFEQLADSYAKENDDLKQRLGSSELEIDDLRLQLGNLQGALQWKQTTEAEIAPESELPPTTIAEAIDRARQSLDRLYLGKDVDSGVATLSPDAGPPDKVLDYLKALQKMAQAQSAGPLGVTQVQWLKDIGVHASRESETIRNSDKEMRKRIWHGLNGRQKFETHLKPNDSISPNKCVRIYFDFDHKSTRVVVGWIGRHPE